MSQKKLTARRLSLMIASLGLLVVLGLLIFEMQGRTPPQEIQLSQSRVDVGGDFTLIDQTGAIRTQADFAGRYMLIYFGFTYCPDVCPTTLIKMADVIDRLGDDSDSVNSIFISIDPERDKEEVIKDYVSAFHEEIIGLTGSEEQISNVAKDWGVYYQKEDIEGSDDYTVNHLDIIFLANANGEYVDFFPPKIQSALIVEKVRNIINKN